MGQKVSTTPIDKEAQDKSRILLYLFVITLLRGEVPRDYVIT